MLSTGLLSLLNSEKRDIFVKKTIKKLNSKKGVTIVMALLFFLMATMVASIIIASANSATRKVTYDRYENQAYLTVSTVAEYLATEIETYDFEIVKTVSTKSGTSEKDIVYNQECDLSPIMKRVALYAKNNSSTAVFPNIVINGHFDLESGEFNEDVNSDDISIGDIKVTISVEPIRTGNTKEGLDIYLTVESLSSLDKNSANYKMTICLRSNKVESKTTQIIKSEEAGVSDEYIEKTRTEYYWVRGSIEKGSQK